MNRETHDKWTRIFTPPRTKQRTESSSRAARSRGTRVRAYGSTAPKAGAYIAKLITFHAHEPAMARLRRIHCGIARHVRDVRGFVFLEKVSSHIAVNGRAE